MKFDKVTRIFAYATEVAAANSDFIILSENENHSKSTKSLLNRLKESWKDFELVDEKILPRRAEIYS